MQDMLLTAIIPIVLCLLALYGVKQDDKAFFSKNCTNALKGLASVVVVLVHVREAHGNPLQDAIGSFAFVGVTFFFLVSSYGMHFAIDKNPNYLSTFWRNRLISLLIPVFFVNICQFGIHYFTQNELCYGKLWSINRYVLVLLQYCILFYFVELYGRRRSDWVLDYVIVSVVVVSSLCLYLYAENAYWSFERIGLVWGILLYRFFGSIRRYFESKRFKKVFLWGIGSLILGVLYLKFKSVPFFGEYLLKISLGFVILVFFFVLTSKYNIGNNRFAQFLGDISFEVYLSHDFVMALVDKFTNLPSGQFILLSLALTILLSSAIRFFSSKLVRILRS